MIIDPTAAARRPDPERVREWLADQRVFISSALGDTPEERRAVAAAVEESGARAAWFEEFGRDADAEEAYLSEVDSSTIYVGVLNELYGRPNLPDGDSATEMEYRRAREAGKRIAVYVNAAAPGREGALARFIERIRFFITTETYNDSADLARRVRRRLEELAAEALSPWIKLDDYVFRADEIVDSGDAISIRARVSEEIAHRLEVLRDQRFTSVSLCFVSRSRVVEADLAGVERTTRAAGAEELTITLSGVRRPAADAMRAGTTGHSADDLVELGLRSVLLGEETPDQVRDLSFLTDPGIAVDDLRQAFDLPNEYAESVLRLVLAEGLVTSGSARRIVSLSIGPRLGDSRRIALAWEEPGVFAGHEPVVRSLEGQWRRPEDRSS